MKAVDFYLTEVELNVIKTILECLEVIGVLLFRNLRGIWSQPRNDVWYVRDSLDYLLIKLNLSYEDVMLRSDLISRDAALPSQKTQVMKRSLSTNGKAARNEPKMFQRSTSLVKPSPVTVNRDASAGSNNVIKEIASKLLKSGN
ncbi:hypothetical protein Tco_0984834 [Tanacetum coccineum]|uniref:Uncharacterized protein n=1 Tax=Tanacetum coccineum TaxID=301880 RepID=A0ABQ5E9P4_9ASTR